MKQILLVVLASTAFAAGTTLEIKVDQVGYLSKAVKVALVSSNTHATEFTVNRSKDGKIAFRGRLSGPTEDGDSGDMIQAADFSDWQTPGDYYLDVPGVGRSWDFAIGPDVYAKTWRLAMRSYYGQRCGIAVDLAPDFPGYKHEACHLEGAFGASSGKTGAHVSMGGWHDAGDYGRYVVNSGVSTGTLLWAYEMYAPRLKSIKLDIPESGMPVPDMLSEIKWNLDWMLTMQDADGGVWQKQTSEKFSDFIMPEKDKLMSFVIGTGKEPYKTTCATADFAAAMAIAGRVYQPFNPAYGNKSLAAAQKAWLWIEKNPKAVFHNPAGVATGEYGDSHCEDERLWAAAELFRSTGEAVYQKYFIGNYKPFLLTSDDAEPPSWNNVASLALWTYAQAKGADSQAVNAIHQDMIRAADGIIKRIAYNRYRTSLMTRDYIWGSNGVAANYGMQLLVADELVHNPRYREAALEDLHYLLGRNTFSLSFVTRVGENAVKHPHHRPSGADSNEEPWPGLLTGGPNKDRQDPVSMKKLSPDTPPAKMYLDDQEAYACNEVAINWNAPLVFLLAGATEGTAADGARPPGKTSHRR